MKNMARQTGGSNLTGISQFNERLILQLIRRAGSLPKAEIARTTNLSAQTATVIINRLIEQKLLIKRKTKISTGRAGQPPIPIALNPNGAFSIGVKIGRRSLNIILINFVGEILQERNHTYEYPDPSFIFPAIKKSLKELISTLSDSEYERLIGIGIAAPYSLGGWQTEAAIPDHITEEWNTIDIKKEVQSDQEINVLMVNDATAACIASLEYDDIKTLDNYLYIFIGTFIGGGIILNRTLYNGRFNNAGAIGSMPLPGHYATPSQDNNKNDVVQLIHCASSYIARKQLKSVGGDYDTAVVAYSGEEKQNLPAEQIEIMDNWVAQSSSAIAYAIVSSMSVIDFDGVIIDGLMPKPLTEELTQQTEAAIQKFDLEGLCVPQLKAGSIGNRARALGGAFLPFYTHFTPDRDLLVSSEKHIFSAF